MKLGVRYHSGRAADGGELRWRFGRQALYGPGRYGGVNLMATPYTLPGYPAHYRTGLSPVTAVAAVPAAEDAQEADR
jgi:hypothetical protein